MTEQEQNRQNQQYQNDEIDLRKLFQAIGSFFTNIWKGLMSVLITIRRATISHLIFFVILIIVGGLLGFFSVKTSDPYYRTSMLLNSSIFKGQLIENSVEKLNLLCQESDRLELSKTLGIPIEIADSIRGFEAIPFVSEEEIIQVEVLREQLRNLQTDDAQVEQVIRRIQIENKSTYEIVVRVYDTDIIPRLEKPLLNYFRGNPYIKKRLEITKKNRELKRDKLYRDVQKMDSLKRAIYANLSTIADRNREGSNNVILAEDNNMANPISIFREDMILYDDLLKIEEQLMLEPEFEVVDGFATFTKPESPGSKKSIRNGVLIAIGLGYLFLLLKGVNSYLSKIEEDQKANSMIPGQ